MIRTFLLRGTLSPADFENYYTGAVGRVVLCNWSPACTVKYRQSTLQATLSLTLTPCKSMQGGLGFQEDSRSFHTGFKM